MAFQIKRTKARCAVCPLRGQNKVFGYSERASAPTMVFVGEAPGEQEDIEGRPFVGPAGRLFRSALSRAGIRPENVYMTNRICCRPPANNISSPQALAAIECCKPGLDEELRQLEAFAKVFVAVGNTAKAALNPDMYRGYLYPRGKRMQMTTYHPSYILRGAEKDEPTWINDLAKAREVALGKVKLIEPKLEMFPSIEYLEKRTKQLISAKTSLGVDIETSGFRWGEVRIIVVGIAAAEDDAFSIPFLSRGGNSYWPTKDLELRAWECVRKLMAHCPTMFQNAPFDVTHLNNAGCRVKHLEHDLLLAHHAMHPELPHSLEYIASCFAKMPAWKGAVKNDPRRMLDMEDTELRTYNLKDALAIPQCLPPIIEDITADGTLAVYLERSMPRVELVLELTDAGVKIDREKLAAWKLECSDRKDTLEGELRTLCGMPDAFNFASQIHMRWLLYGVKPPTLEAKRKELAAYDEADTKKKKTTKKYRELKGFVDVFAVEPFPKLGLKVRTTDSGAESLNELARMSLQIAINNRKAEVSALKRPTKAHAKELTRLDAFTSFLATFGDYQEVSKLLSTYANPPIGPDGRVHPTYMIHGTANSRLSSRDPNWQNIPAHSKLGLGFRRACVPEPGWGFTKADYSNMELQVLAYACDDQPMLEAFARGESLHDIHCGWFFPQLDPEGPLWKHARFATKKYNFGRLAYGGTPRGIYEKIVIEVPELGLTFAEFMRIDRKCMSMHQAFVRWRDAMIRSILETRCVTSGLGRKRYLLGDERAIQREGINSIIQSTAGEIALEGQLEMKRQLQKALPTYKPRVIISDHDGVVVEHRIKDRPQVVDIMLKTLQFKVDLWKHRGVSFPVEVEWSDSSWGEMQPWKGTHGKAQEGVATVPRRRSPAPIRRKP